EPQRGGGGSLKGSEVTGACGPSGTHSISIHPRQLVREVSTGNGLGDVSTLRAEGGPRQGSLPPSPAGSWDGKGLGTRQARPAVGGSARGWPVPEEAADSSKAVWVGVCRGGKTPGLPHLREDLALRHEHPERFDRRFSRVHCAFLR
ncbi:unnamed protein product, partial [Rangifer tarandus platyrhynchus]